MKSAAEEKQKKNSSPSEMISLNILLAATKKINKIKIVVQHRGQ
jgi:hypothetical protein